MTVSKIFYWKEGRLNASLNRDRDGQQTVVEILSKIFQFQSRHGYGGGGRQGFGMGASKTGEGLNKQLMRPLMTTLAPKTLGKYQDASKYWRRERDESACVWRKAMRLSCREATFNKQK